MGARGESVGSPGPIESLKVVATYSEEFQETFPIPPEFGPFPLPAGYTCSSLVTGSWCALTSVVPCVPPAGGCLVVTVLIRTYVAVTIFDFYGVPIGTFDTFFDKVVTVEAQDVGTPYVYCEIVTLDSTSCQIVDGLNPVTVCGFDLVLEILDSVDLVRGPEEYINTFTATPNSAVTLCDVQVDAVKTYLTTLSGTLTAFPTPPRTVASIITCFANIYPGSIQVVQAGGNVYLQFNATLWWVVQQDDASVALLSNTVLVQALIGPTGQIKVVPGSWTIPSLTCVNPAIGAGGTSVTGNIQVGPMSVDVCEDKSVTVVLDPEVPDPVGDPIDPL